MLNKGQFAFQVNTEVDHQTGDILAIYFRIRKGKSVKTHELANGAAFADYDKKGFLLGIELLAPCKITVLNKLVGKEPTVQRFIERSAPRDMLVSC